MAALATDWIERHDEYVVMSDAERRRSSIMAVVLVIGAVVLAVVFALVLSALE